jgi:hypothetical protein
MKSQKSEVGSQNSRFAHFLCRFQLWVLLKIKDF